jgi:hypothetical protein
MVLGSKFGGNTNTSTGAYLKASLDFMVNPGHETGDALKIACIEHNPVRAADVSAYVTKHGAGIPASAPALQAASAAPQATAKTAAKQPGSGI